MTTTHKKRCCKKELDTGSVGQSGCPCGEVKGRGYSIEVHCWRVGNCCPLTGVHWSAKKGHAKKALAHARKIKEYLEEGWNAGVAITSKPRL